MGATRLSSVDAWEANVGRTECGAYGMSRGYSCKQREDEAATVAKRKLALSRPIAFIDLETTGFSPVSARIVEIGVLKIMPNGFKHQYYATLDPEVGVPPEATRFTESRTIRFRENQASRKSLLDLRTFWPTATSLDSTSLASIFRFFRKNLVVLVCRLA